MEPTEALRLIESSLRSAIRTVLPDQTWSKRPGAPDIARLAHARDEERKRRDGVIASDDLLEYAMTFNLTDLILKNWEDFRPVFDDHNRTKAYFDIINDTRNPIAHSRDLVPAERDLLSGIAGQLANQVSIHMSRLDAPSRYYPTIVGVSDNFGRTLYATSHAYECYRDRIRIDVGQPVALSGVASSARGKAIAWMVRVTSHGRRSHVYAAGASLQLEYEYRPTIDDVTEDLLLSVYIKSESQFRRHPDTPGALDMPPGGYDDERHIRYSVNPPEDA